MAVIPALMAVGAAAQAYGQYRAGQANEDAARRNAVLANQAADIALQKGEQAATLRRMAGEKRVAQQVEGYATSGVDVQSGSPVKVISATAMTAELDAQIQKNNAYRTAWGYRTQAANFSQQAEDYGDMKYLNAIGSILGGAGGVIGAMK